MSSVPTVEVRKRDREGVPMSGQAEELEQQHMLLMVESAQRAGRSEDEIVEIVDDAIEADGDLERAA
jgi:hypothetical protein